MEHYNLCSNVTVAYIYILTAIMICYHSDLTRWLALWSAFDAHWTQLQARRRAREPGNGSPTLSRSRRFSPLYSPRMKASRSPPVTAETPWALPCRPPGIQHPRYVHNFSVGWNVRAGGDIMSTQRRLECSDPGDPSLFSSRRWRCEAGGMFGVGWMGAGERVWPCVRVCARDCVRAHVCVLLWQGKRTSDLEDLHTFACQDCVQIKS